VAPAEWAASTIGISSSSVPSNAEKAYAAFAAARTFGGGITLAAMIASGNRKAVAIFLMAGVTTALTDAWVCARFGGEMALRHALMDGLTVAVGGGWRFG
jgi:tetrahydromethanopterin S-methyltransferase subunit E